MGCLVGQTVDRLVGQTVDRLVGQLEGRRGGCLADRLLDQKMGVEGALARFSWPVAQVQALLPARQWVVALAPLRQRRVGA